MTPQDDNASHPPRRRKRYSGTHPRRFDQRYKELDPQRHGDIHEHIRRQGRTPAGTHVPVLMREVLAELSIREGETVVDCTLGYGGHAAEFMKRVAPAGKLIGLDRDDVELSRTAARLKAVGDWASLHHANFAAIARILDAEKIRADVIFADLGVSSMQVDDPARGFSYKHENAPLDMRMDPSSARTAADLLATISQADLAAALSELADEPDAAKIAEWIVNQRQVAPIENTGQLTRLVLNAKGFSPRGRHKPWQKPGGLHPAALTFQALRILVNDELASLRELLRVAPQCLSSGGRTGIISFHSGEDRLVKNAFREGVRTGVYAEASDKPIRPSPREVTENPRSSSAKFRWARRGGQEAGGDSA